MWWWERLTWPYSSIDGDDAPSRPVGAASWKCPRRLPTNSGSSRTVVALVRRRGRTRARRRHVPLRPHQCCWSGRAWLRSSSAALPCIVGLADYASSNGDTARIGSNRWVPGSSPGPLQYRLERRLGRVTDYGPRPRPLSEPAFPIRVVVPSRRLGGSDLRWVWRRPLLAALLMRAMKTRSVNSPRLRNASWLRRCTPRPHRVQIAQLPGAWPFGRGTRTQHQARPWDEGVAVLRQPQWRYLERS